MATAPASWSETELDFNGQGAFGLGPLSYEAQRGMYLHPTYAVTPARTAGHCRRVDVGAARREAARDQRARWRQADRVALAETRRRQIALDLVLLHRFITGSNMQG